MPKEVSNSGQNPSGNSYTAYTDGGYSYTNYNSGEFQYLSNDSHFELIPKLTRLYMQEHKEKRT